MSAPYRRVGRVVGTHGTSGEVVVALADRLSCRVLEPLSVWIVPPIESGAVLRKVLGVRTGPKGALVRIEGVDNVGQAHDVNGRWLMARSADLPDLPPAPEDEIGYRVVDVDHGDLGVITSIIVTGANDVLVVNGGPYGEVLLPVIDDVILAVDVSRRSVSVRVLPGLIEALDS